MNKINIILSTACALAVINNSFGMLTKASSIKQIKKTRFFHTTKPMLNIFDILAWQNASDASAKADNNQELLKKNHELLHKIIQQNEDNNKLLKENNLLLRTIAKQNYVYARQDTAFANPKELQERLTYWTHNGFIINNTRTKSNKDLLEHYYALKKQYDIDITHELE